MKRAADAAFEEALILDALATLYGVAAVYVVDAFKPGKPANTTAAPAGER